MPPAFESFTSQSHRFTDDTSNLDYRNVGESNGWTDAARDGWNHGGRQYPYYSTEVNSAESLMSYFPQAQDVLADGEDIPAQFDNVVQRNRSSIARDTETGDVHVTGDDGQKYWRDQSSGEQIFEHDGLTIQSRANGEYIITSAEHGSYSVNMSASNGTGLVVTPFGTFRFNQGQPDSISLMDGGGLDEEYDAINGTTTFNQQNGDHGGNENQSVRVNHRSGQVDVLDSDGDIIFSFSIMDQSLWTADIRFSPSGTYLAFADVIIGVNGELYDRNGLLIMPVWATTALVAGVVDKAVTFAMNMHSIAQTSKNNFTASYNDVSMVVGGLGELCAAMNTCIAANCPALLKQLIEAQGKLQSLLSQLYKPAEINRLLLCHGVTDQTSLTNAQRNCGNRTVEQQVEYSLSTVGK